MKKIWVDPGFVDNKTSHFNGNVEYTNKMTLHYRNTIQINARTFRTEKYLNNINVHFDMLIRYNNENVK